MQTDKPKSVMGWKHRETQENPSVQHKTLSHTQSPASANHIGCVCVCPSHVVTATETALSPTELPVIWRCWQVTLLRDLCDHNKLVQHAHTHTGRDVTGWESQWQCGILSASIMQCLWQLEESNSLHRLTPSFFSLSLFLSISPHVALYPLIHLRSLRYPLVCYGMKTERELESRRKEQQRKCCSDNFAGKYCEWQQHIWPYGIKTLHKRLQQKWVFMPQLICRASVCKSLFTGFVSCSCIIRLADLSYQPYIQQCANPKTQRNVCHNQRAVSSGGTAAICSHDRWELLETLECVHTDTQRTEPEACWVWMSSQWLSPTAIHINLYCLLPSGPVCLNKCVRVSLLISLTALFCFTNPSPCLCIDIFVSES